MTSATSALSVAALAKADDWRAHVGEPSDASSFVDVVRSHEPGRGREANTPEEIPPRGWSDIVTGCSGRSPPTGSHRRLAVSLSSHCSQSSPVSLLSYLCTGSSPTRAPLVIT